MSGNIVNTNLRLNLDNPEDRRAWERLQRMDRTRYKSYSRAVVAALNDFFDRQECVANDPYLETREKEEAFLQRVLDTLERGLRSATPRPQTLSVTPTPDNVNAKSGSANASQTPDSEGVAARAMEAAGIISDRCELNRQIKADNLLLRTLKAQVKKLLSVVKNTVIGIARALETVRKNLLIFRYHILHSGADKKRIASALNVLRPDVARYEELAAQIKDASKERKALLDEKKATSPMRVIRHHELARGIAKLTEDLEELKNERTILLSQYAGTDGTLSTGVQAVRNRISFLEATLQKVERRESKYTVELEAALAQYRELQEQVKDVDGDALDAARQSVRPDMEREAYQQAREVYGKRYDSGLMRQSRKDVAAMLGERERQTSVREQLQQARQKSEKQAHYTEQAKNR